MMIGVTGSFGCGKTTVAKMFARLGAYAIDVDKVYHSLIRRGEKCHKEIVKYFGKDILAKSGQIDREKLGKIVFKDRSKLKLLNSITYSGIMEEIKKIVKSKKSKFIIIDAPLLIESGFYKKVDSIILVANKKEYQVKRIKESTGLSVTEILKRIRMQMPFKKKLAFADFIIDNSGSKLGTLTQVREIWKQRGA
ncbi:MAG: dephospho-CoA kinase [Candidatus Omnitrophica bacterium]|nr:dephospho-CoA kinase [Candidatus Omnitrophota bacterium]